MKSLRRHITANSPQKVLRCRDALRSVASAVHLAALLVLMPLTSEAKAQDVQPAGPAFQAPLPATPDTLPRTVVLVRTNLLVPLMDIGLEFPLGQHLTLGGDFYSPWLGYDEGNSRCFQVQMADAEVRWWFRPRVFDGVTGNTFTGHSVGLGFFGGHADFEKDFSGVQVEGYGVYVDYKWSAFLKKYLRMHFSLGVGFGRFPYRKYQVYTYGGKLIRTDPGHETTINWFGPIKAEVSLAVPIYLKPKCCGG